MTYEQKREAACFLGTELISLLTKASFIYKEIEKLDITEEDNNKFESDLELSKITDDVEKLLEQIGWD